ncbi:MAG: SAM-dependent methyltransferase [Bacteroidetes bacterium RIFCSPLOWO2_12_FULL_31_6]|nr:MAG: SAM-dependent methyltransferase [Bacteroidetes bacterium RIFCSPLOWO2_12_FULL_31_6]
MKLDKSYWNQRYIEKTTGWDVGEITTPLKEYVDQLKDKNIRIIIPGCGNAYEAEYLFLAGFLNVFLIDFSPIALNQFIERVPNFPKNQLICDDFFNHYYKYDILLEQTFFCALSPTLRTNYAKHTADILNTNGKIVGLLFNEVNVDHPPFGGNKEEYLTYFAPYFNINIIEPAYNSIAPRKNRELFIKFTKK